MLASATFFTSFHVTKLLQIAFSVKKQMI